MKIKIVPSSPHGVVTGQGTRFYLEDGSEITGVTRCTVTYEIDSFVTAELEIEVNPGEVFAHPLLGLDTVKAAAKAYGYHMVCLRSKALDELTALGQAMGDYD